MRYVKTFLVSAPLFALFYHWVTIEPLPWWPDTVVMGVFMGALAAFVLMRLTFAHKAGRHLRNAGVGLWRVTRRGWGRDA